ncbi:hypothetical protein D3C73_983790 [compost metagenome]
MLVEAGKPQFQIETVGEDQLCALCAFNVARRGLIFVNFSPRLGNGADLGCVTRHVARHIGNHRKGGDHLKFFLRRCRRQRQRRQDAGKEKRFQMGQARHSIPHKKVVNLSSNIAFAMLYSTRHDK